MRTTLKLIFIIANIFALADVNASDCEREPPLREHHIGVQIKGGIAPTQYTRRGAIWLVDPNIYDDSFTDYKIPCFRQQFQTPYEIGLEFQWNASAHVQFFIEGVYTHGAGKTHRIETYEYETIKEKYHDFTTWSGYLGARYYFDRRFCNISPFLGCKAGFVHHNKIDYSINLFDYSIPNHNPYYKSQTVLSGGLQGGLDWKFCHGWSCVFTAEVVFTAGLRNNRNVVLDSDFTDGLTNINLGETGTLISYPITLGLRYEF